MSATQHPNDEAQKKNSTTDPIKQPEEVNVTDGEKKDRDEL